MDTSSANVFSSPQIIFPKVTNATKEGLVAIGGDLLPETLLSAYRQGIFPWYSKNEPILWWSPDPRLVLYPKELIISRRLDRLIRQGHFKVTLDNCFKSVIEKCADSRTANGEDTWITPAMVDAYTLLHELGYAHSVEAWDQSELVGGLYGISLGGCFFGESMFSQKSNASKVALAFLCTILSRYDFDLIDCQVTSNHLRSLGANPIPRLKFLLKLEQALLKPTLIGSWAHRVQF